MNTVVTSRQALLAASRTVARRQGLGGLSIRAVAAEARVSVGSVYNYISGKTDGVTITSKNFETVGFDMNQGSANVLAIILCIVIPILVIVLGIVIWVRRRHR